MNRATVAAMVVGTVCLGVAVVVGSGSAGPQTTPDGVLATGFGSALADADKFWSAPPANVWLSGLGTPSTAFGKSVKVGDVITISGRSAQPQTIEITELEQVDGRAIGLKGVRFQLVTGRATSDSQGTPVRFLFAVDRLPEHPLPISHRLDRVL